MENEDERVRGGMGGGAGSCTFTHFLISFLIMTIPKEVE